VLAVNGDDRLVRLSKTSRPKKPGRLFYMTTRREQRTELARSAPELPEEMPAKVRGKPQPLTQIVKPFVDKRFKGDAAFRMAAASINTENSPNGRICFDDRDLAAAIKEDGEKAQVQRIIDASMGLLSTTIKRVLAASGVGRSQRVAKAKEALMLGSAQPAE
jgi:hypothetical protein